MAGLQGLRALFYLLTPNESSFRRLEEVPAYVDTATPYFLGMLLLELLLGWAKNREMIIKINDGATSVSAGMLSRLPHLFMRSVELSSYVYIWKHYHIVELPWNSAWTWWLAFLGVDLGYYWLHRMSHELNILWAAHQVHHSSEFYNLSTALRQSVLQQMCTWMFYLPMALAVPPSLFAVHVQFNLLYQFWIHTEVVGQLGPLEWILNTPSHHRVHHGRNPYCIDRNYGGTLIIWDRLFGTFAPEGDKVIYGLTKPLRTFETMTVQFHYYPYLWKRIRCSKGIINKLWVIFKGPSWRPGLPRLGNRSNVPKVSGEEVPYSPAWSLTMQVYMLLHFLLLLTIYNDVFTSQGVLSEAILLLMTSYIIFSLTTLGFIVEQRPGASALETLRLLICVMLLKLEFVRTTVPLLSLTVDVFVLLSLLYWVLHFACQLVDWGKKHH